MEDWRKGVRNRLTKTGKEREGVKSERINSLVRGEGVRRKGVRKG